MLVFCGVFVCLCVLISMLVFCGVFVCFDFNVSVLWCVCVFVCLCVLIPEAVRVLWFFCIFCPELPKPKPKQLRKYKTQAVRNLIK